MQAYSLIFAHAISEEERDPARQSSCLTLTLLLTDPYLSSLLNVKAGTTAPGAMGWSASLTREARPIAEGKEDEKDKKKGTGGGFFSSLGIGGGGGVKKDPQPQEQEGAGKGAGSGGTTSAAVAKGTETAKVNAYLHPHHLSSSEKSFFFSSGCWSRCSQRSGNRCR